MLYMGVIKRDMSQQKARNAGLVQKFFGNPACFKIPLAVCLETIVYGTLKLFSVRGLNHISWLPFPCLSK